MVANPAFELGPGDNGRLSGTVAGLIEEHLLDQVFPTAKEDVRNGFLLLSNAPQSSLYSVILVLKNSLHFVEYQCDLFE